MKPMSLFYILVSLFLTVSCSSDDTTNTSEPTPTEDPLYFPPIGSDIWETTSATDLGWNTNELQQLLDFLETTNTESFMMLYNGRIVNETYFGTTTVSSNNPWFSTGKTLTAFMTGIAQEEGYLSLENPSSDYLGQGWSYLTSEQEQNIKVVHHITMTSGLDYTDDLFCTDFDCLIYLNNPGTFWYYHNAPYTLTQSIISGAIDSDFDSYFNSKLRDRIGMQGAWINSGYNRFYFSTARSMARFGLLCLNNGTWDDEIILGDMQFFNEMTTTSQSMNPAYGYLWWLNGRSSYRIPGSTQLFQGELIHNAPDDLIAGLGANDQKLYIVPSRKLVIIRMGNDAGEGQLGPSGYDNSLWEKISALID
ncbi:MAG: serine hydrolase [Bacteroidota bacterium]